ncbi:MAG: hypothetical protein IPH16_10165 [Haliscomenobacter sp.]|nr:hypothetical protein [Haliscomenobacter sp.]
MRDLSGNVWEWCRGLVRRLSGAFAQRLRGRIRRIRSCVAGRLLGQRCFQLPGGFPRQELPV